MTSRHPKLLFMRKPALFKFVSGSALWLLDYINSDWFVTSSETTMYIYPVLLLSVSQEIDLDGGSYWLWHMHIIN